MHKNELFFDLVFLVTPLDPPLSLPPPYTPLPRGRSIGDPCCIGYHSWVWNWGGGGESGGSNEIICSSSIRTKQTVISYISLVYTLNQIKIY